MIVSTVREGTRSIGPGLRELGHGLQKLTLDLHEELAREPDRFETLVHLGRGGVMPTFA